jgi:hypothetical protein
MKPRCMVPTSGSRKVAALFVRKDSVYKSLAGVDAWDVMRNARYWPGGCPLVAHPPCSQWGELSHMARVDLEEKLLAPMAISFIREWGGVLEHPKKSKLWPVLGLPEPGKNSDEYNGWTLEVSQWWWGHPAEKKTRLYIVGCAKECIPPLPPIPAGRPPQIIGSSGRRKCGGRKPKDRPEVTKKQREYTPEKFALWLVELARRCIDIKK